MSITAYEITGQQPLSTSASGPQAIFEVQITEDNACGYMEARAIARRASDGASKVIFMSCAWKRNTGGITLTPQLLREEGTVADLLALLGATAQIDSYSNGVPQHFVRVQVDGIAATDIDWAVIVDGWYEFIT